MSRAAAGAVMKAGSLPRVWMNAMEPMVDAHGTMVNAV
jgi:hypothetical protein